ncbi:hypothetical protein [Mobiluncus sp.]|uniref:hypothetical protein n=1 Tax=Mobiluncus sp. TaxID=47293 RepID=UPI002A91AD68|nr:hypothetical protein [Mobiluncus sp.]MDY6076989.1 hypothetical protein [Mobiluncus sp.]
MTKANLVIQRIVAIFLSLAVVAHSGFALWQMYLSGKTFYPSEHTTIYYPSVPLPSQLAVIVLALASFGFVAASMKHEFSVGWLLPALILSTLCIVATGTVGLIMATLTLITAAAYFSARSFLRTPEINNY